MAKKATNKSKPAAEQKPATEKPAEPSPQETVPPQPPKEEPVKEDPPAAPPADPPAAPEPPKDEPVKEDPPAVPEPVADAPADDEVAAKVTQAMEEVTAQAAASAGGRIYVTCDCDKVVQAVTEQLSDDLKKRVCFGQPTPSKIG